MPQDDQTFMAVALAMAARGRGQVEPNPMVGAVIVRDGEIIARGWHKFFGGPHAEIEALADAKRAGAPTRDATMYVTLEPCCHHGKTPPCTEAVIEAGISRLVAAMQDPDAQVAGSGIEQLRRAGVDVSVGTAQRAASRLLAAYVKLRTQGRPWVICKWAQTAGGYMALPAGAGRWISSEQSRTHVHHLRGRCDGILAGISTVLADDPLLNNRSGEGKQPARVVLDSSLRTPIDCQLIRTAADAPVIVATSADTAGDNTAIAKDLSAAGVEILTLPSTDGGVSLEALLDELGRRQWTHLLVEGGAKVLDSFISLGLADELLVYVNPQPAGASDDSPLPRFDIADVLKTVNPVESSERQIGPDKLLRIILHE